VAVNLRRHPNLIPWAKQRGVFVCADRDTQWGTQCVLGKGGLLRALRPYGDRSTSVGEAVQRCTGPGHRAGRAEFEEFAGMVMAAAEARQGATVG
jgi:hypothetical protein